MHSYTSHLSAQHSTGQRGSGLRDFLPVSLVLRPSPGWVFRARRFVCGLTPRLSLDTILAAFILQYRRTEIVPAVSGLEEPSIGTGLLSPFKVGTGVTSWHLQGTPMLSENLRTWSALDFVGYMARLHLQDSGLETTPGRYLALRVP